MKKLIILAFLFTSLFTYSQVNKIIIDKTKIENRTIYLLGGIASVITEKDIEFQKKYNVVYYDFGCVAPANFEEYEIKNKLVFENLTKKYGTIWMNNISKTAIGLTNWQKKKLN